MRRHWRASCGRTKHRHFFEDFTFHFHPSFDEGQKKMSAEFFWSANFEECVQELMESLIVNVL